MAKEKEQIEKEIGITVKKDENFSEWYSQVIQKADLADYSSVSGCIVYKPNSYSIWEKIKEAVDKKIKKMGVKNAYFPLLIPENLLNKEASHIKGFSPEVAWVTHAGNSKLKERLAIRPTSETIMYDSYSKWIRSYNDLPLRLNQWNNVVRWEFKHPIPFLRGREFLWNEGHTCFATKKEAEKEVMDILMMYQDIINKFLALPSLSGQKSEKEKFAGAEYTLSLEMLMPNGKAIQGPDSHFDGQNFAKAFNIKFLDKDGKSNYVWQNTWAISTRMVGIIIAIHGDDKGLVIPPKLAPVQAVIVPILFKDSKTKVLKEAEKIKARLEKKGISAYLDNREGYSAGWKFNEWELKGIPIRIELGPKDLKNKQIILVRRDTWEKKNVSLNSFEKDVNNLLAQIQDNLYKKAEKLLKGDIVTVKNLEEAKKQFKNNKIVFAQWCSSPKCEELIKDKTGAKSLNSPFKQPKISGKCFACNAKAERWFYFGRSY